MIDINVIVSLCALPCVPEAMKQMSHSRLIFHRTGSAAVSLLVLGVLAALPGVAHAQVTGDPVAGRTLAETWCSNCHMVSPDQQRGTSTGAPAFAAVAQMKSTTQLGLRAFLQSPHDRMPDLHLSRNETDDVTAYILSLRR